MFAHAIGGTTDRATRSRSQVSPQGGAGSAALKCAGGALKSLFPEEWSAAFLTVRVPGLDSTISWGVACRSSVAEMTGKSRTSKQVSTSARCSDLEGGRCRSQKQNASAISRSQHRFSSSSNVGSPLSWNPDSQLPAWNMRILTHSWIDLLAASSYHRPRTGGSHCSDKPSRITASSRNLAGVGWVSSTRPRTRDSIVLLR
jgi:hypothetical protein